ncbi:hypothetical protein ACLB2K_041519 [Fragaria x ananassa]
MHDLVEMNMIRWSPPPSNWVKINFDSSVRSKAVAGGFNLKIEAGKPLVATAFNSGVASVPLVETFALRNSLVCAKEKGLSKIEVESDFKLVIDIANGVCDPPWRLLKIFQDFKSLRCNFVSISFKHVLREANFVANALVNIDIGLRIVTSRRSVFLQKHLLSLPSPM